MKNPHLYGLLLSSLLPLLGLCFTPANPPDVTDAWCMIAHRVVPAQDGIIDLYAHFKTDGNLKMNPVRGCQNLLGNLRMKAASKFMPSGKSTWHTIEFKRE